MIQIITMLTKRETEVLTGIANGHTTKEIAKELFLSEHTVISYRKILYQKMNVPNAPALIRKAFEMGYLKAS